MPVPRLMPILPRSPNGQDAHSTKIAERARCPFHLTIKIIPLLILSCNKRPTPAS
ncbi:MAG: hypothetical protein F6K50_49700 [Moorea sp. SIO3I7]|uniref:hypothetical protein n=1 Tax=unclassified Moorena TaxID=2683338 RepID=UPI0013CC530C|nr:MULTISPECIES: hypothetical protein [unclassified Moorena]NEO03113.1 hypothetical protein [Moorena sp. SIO3I7]